MILYSCVVYDERFVYVFSSIAIHGFINMKGLFHLHNFVAWIDILKNLISADLSIVIRVEKLHLLRI